MNADAMLTLAKVVMVGPMSLEITWVNMKDAPQIALSKRKSQCQ